MRDKQPVVSTDESVTEASGELGGRLKGLSLRRQVIVLAIWPLLEFAMGSAVSFTDMAIAGGVTATPDLNTPILDAMSFGSYIAWLLFILQGAVATGTNALVSRAIGGRDELLAKQALGQSIVMGFFAGCFSCACLLIFGKALISFVGLSVEASKFAWEYIAILSLSSPLTGVMVAVNATLRGSGDTRTPFGITCVVNVVNIAFSLALVNWFDMGVAGIALGTVIGWGCGVVLALWKISSKRQSAKREEKRGVAVRLEWPNLRPNREVSMRVLRVGVPSAMEILGMWAINFMGLRFIEQLNVDGALGAHGVAIRIESFSYLPGFALGVAAQTLAGQYLGANNPEKSAKAVREAWKIGVVFMTSVGILFLVVPQLLVSTISRDNELILSLASPLIQLCGLTQPFFATCIVLKMSMRGAGASRLVMQTSYLSMVFYRLLGLYMVVHVFHGTLLHVWMVIALDLVTQAILFSRLHFSGKWMQAKV